MALHSRWTEGLSLEESTQFNVKVNNAKDVLDRLEKIVKQELHSIDVSRRTKQNYDKPGWSELMADQIGSERAFHFILTLIKRGE